MLTNTKQKGDSLFMRLSERSRRLLFAGCLLGVPVLEDAWLLGVSARGVPGLRSVLEECCCSGYAVETLQPTFPLRTPGSPWMASWDSEPSWEGGTGSANELCLTEFRLCALTRDQLVERKLSPSNQKRTKWSAPRSSMKCM